jgi:uncharacterized membrane protein
MDIQATIEISAPPERIWAVMSDVERWPEWTPTVTSVEMLDGGPLRVGVRARIRQPRLPAAVWTVTALDPGRRFTWQSVVPGLTSVGDHRIDVRGTSTISRVTLTLTWHGWMTPIIRLFFGRRSRRYVQLEAESLKRRSERDLR